MNRAMILPAAIAAGLHIALLGFRSAPPSAEPRGAASIPEDRETPVEFPEYVPPASDDPIQRYDPQDPPPLLTVPQQPEVPVIDSTSEYTTHRLPAPEIDVGRIDRIATDWQPNGGDRGGPRVPWVLIGELDNVPRALFRHSPTRPSGTGTDKETVTVDFVVGKDGTVAQMRIVDSTSSSLEDVCLRAVKRWRFEPGMRKNLPVAFRMQQTFVFTIHD